MPALREILASFGFNFDGSGLKQAMTGIDGFANKVKDLADKLTGGDLRGAVKDWISDVKESAGEFKGLAKTTGTGVQDMQRWVTAAKLGGSSAEALAAGFRVLQKNVAGASTGSSEGAVDMADGSLEMALSGKKAQEAFKALKVEVLDANGKIKPTSQLMGDVGLSLAKIKNPAERAAMATKLLGRQGATLLPLFAKGEEGLSQLLDKLDELGGGVSDEALAALAANSKASKEYDIATLSLKSAVASELLPAMTSKVQALVKITVGMSKALKGTNALKAVIVVLGAAYAIAGRQAIIAGAKAALAWAPVAIGLALLVLLVDDLITTFEGGDSVISRVGRKWLEFLSGSESGTKASQDTWDAFVASVKDTSWGDIFSGAWDYWTHDLAASLDGADTSIKAWLFGIKDDIEQAGDYIQAGFGIIIDYLTHLPEHAKDAGTAIMTALADSIRDGIDLVKESLDALGSGFIGKLRSIFDWHSPPGLTVGLGSDLVKGLTMSLKAGDKDIQKQAGETFGQVIPELAQPVIRIPQARPGQVYSPTSVDQKNTIQIKIEAAPGAQGTANAVRQGVSSGLDDGLDGTLSALEALGD